MFDPVFALLFLLAIAVPIAALIYWGRPKNRSAGKAGCLVPLGFAVAAIAAFVFYAGPDLFVTNDGMFEVYVVAPQQKADGFTDQLASTVRQLGMTSDVSHVPWSDGTAFHALDSRGHWLNLWSQNLPLDRDLPAKECGPAMQWPTDPGQYVLRVSRILPFGTKQAARDLSLELAAKLRAVGYEVRSKPLKCSPWLKDRVLH
jgi:hypothetical protein